MRPKCMQSLRSCLCDGLIIQGNHCMHQMFEAVFFTEVRRYFEVRAAVKRKKSA